MASDEHEGVKELVNIYSEFTSTNNIVTCPPPKPIGTAGVTQISISDCPKLLQRKVVEISPKKEKVISHPIQGVDIVQMNEERPPLVSKNITWKPTFYDAPLKLCTNGMRNLGNTCYLNSVLQCLYSIRALRTGLEVSSYNPASSLAGALGVLFKLNSSSIGYVNFNG